MNVRENRRTKHELTIQKQTQHWAQDTERQKKNTTKN